MSGARLASSILALATVGCAHAAPTAPAADDEAAVWAAALAPETLGGEGGDPAFVRNVTAFGEAPGARVPDKVVAALKLEGEPRVLDLGPRLVEANRVARTTVAPAQSSGHPVVLVADAARADGSCVHELARPAFGGRWALALVRTRCGPRCGGATYTLLERRAGSWAVRRRIRAFSS